MAHAGQIILFQFPQTNLLSGKLRPALIIDKLPGVFDDWLICMISTQIRHYNKGFDDLISITDTDFTQSGLKKSSIFRVGRLAVVDGSVLIGSVGSINQSRLKHIKASLAKWLSME